MLVCHAVDDYTTSSSSSEVCRFAQEHPSGMIRPTPERHQIEVPRTVYVAVMMAVLGRVATARQIAPWSKDLTCQSHHAVGAAFWSTSVGGFARSQSDMGIAQRRKSDRRTPQKVRSAPICSAGHGHGPVELWARQTLARRALPKVSCFTSADGHLEIASPSMCPS